MEEAANLLGPDGEQTDERKQFWKDQRQVNTEEWQDLLCNCGRA